MAGQYDLGRAEGRIAVDTTDLDRLQSKAKTTTGAVEQRFKTLGAGMAKFGRSMSLFVTLPLVGLGYVATQEASHVGEALDFMRDVFGESADDIESWSDRAIDSLGLAKSSALDAANMLGVIIQESLGTTEQGAADLSKKLVQLAVDMASAADVPLEEALVAVRAGLTGETEPLKRFGVLLTDVALEQYALEQGIKKSVGTMGAQEKATLRINALFAKTEKFAGNYAKTSDSLANRQRKFTEELKNTGAEIGEMLIPIAQKLVGWLSGLAKWFRNLDKPTQELIVKIAAIAAAIGPLLWIGGKLIGSIFAIGRAFRVLGAIMSFNPFLLLIAAVVALVIIIVKNWDKIKDFLIKTWNAIVDAVGKIFGPIVGFFKNIWEGVRDTAIKVWDGIVDFFQTIPEKIRAAVAALPDLLIKLFILALKGIWEAIKLQWRIIIEFWKNVPRLILQALIKLPGLLLSLGGLLIRGLWEGIKLGWRLVVVFFRNVPRLILKAIGSLGKLLLNVGRAILRGLWEGIKAVALGLWDWFKSVPGRIKNFFSAAWKWLVNAGKDIIRGLRNGIVSFVTGVWDWFKSLPERIMNFFSDVKKWLLQAGRDLIQGFIDGIKDMIGALGRTVGGLAQSTEAALRNATKSGSPSKVFMKVGEDLMKGLELGILQRQKDLERIMPGMVEAPQIRVPGGRGAAVAGGLSPTTGTSGGGMRGLAIVGEIDLTSRSTAVIRGVVVEEIREEDGFKESVGRMGRS